MPNDSSILEFPNPSQPTANVTLDGLVQAMAQWRANKQHVAEQIPEFIWQQIYVLLQTYPEPTVRAVTGISNPQLQRKLQERAMRVDVDDASPTSPVEFCEAKEDKTIKSKPLYQPTRIPATNTLIVEFCRHDGRVMKIHTTTDSFAELMKAFFEDK